LTNCNIVLEDGTRFAGRFIGEPGVVVAEVVFNTSMTGYQEILTDPSYRDQIVLLTAPQIGNTGVNSRDMESERLQAAGLIVRDAARRTSSWRAEGSLREFLDQAGAPGVTDVDTRALTKHLRTAGAMLGAIAPASVPVEELMAKLKAEPPMQGRDLASQVTCPTPFVWHRGEDDRKREPRELTRSVVVLDFGVKRSILRRLVDAGFFVEVVPATTSAKDILARRPHGVLLSNGPGDPAAVTYAIETIRELLGQVPLFGICLGHQLLALALGGQTYKLKFGHRGGNHPVRHPDGGSVGITAQNHGFAVAPELPAGVEITEINLSDGTVEGLTCLEKYALSVQYHPEAGPGPRDAVGWFETFRLLVDDFAKEGKSSLTVETRSIGCLTRST
jgi:carbamoyl-phosphate synthase small subunit